MLVVPTLVAPVAAVADPTSAASLGSRTLRAGVNGADVRELQQLLQRAGFEVTADGSFEAATAEAVKAFQAVAGLTPSGTAGRKTVARLRAATRSGANAANNGGVGFGSESVGARPRARALGDRIPVRRGMSGRDVKMLQDFLKRAGVQRVTVDGEFGTGTTRAVRAWEREVDRRVDGVVDAADIHKLRTAVGAVPGAVDSQTSPRSAPLQLAAGSRAKVGDDGLAIAPADAPRGRQADHRRRQRDRHEALPLRRRAWPLERRGLRLLGQRVLRAARRGPARDRAPLQRLLRLGRGRRGPVGHDLHQVEPHVHGGRRPALRHERAQPRRTRWQADMRDTSGYRSRHPAGL